jgi:hypothetical protein
MELRCCPRSISGPSMLLPSACDSISGPSLLFAAAIRVTCRLRGAGGSWGDRAGAMGCGSRGVRMLLAVA